MNRFIPNRKRVVVTGVGIVSCLGHNVQSVWAKVLAGECGIKKLTSPSYDKLPCRVAGLVSWGTGEGEFNQNLLGKPGETSYYSDASLFGMKAINEALDDADWHPSTEEEMNFTGISLGSSMSIVSEIISASGSFNTHGFRKLSPYFIPKVIINITAGFGSIKHKFKGPNMAYSTACSTGVHSIGSSYRYIKNGMARVMVCGATESPIDPITIAGFTKAKALSVKYNDNPMKASRPFDSARSGFVMSEGAGIVVLEDYEHALSRRAPIYAEIIGYGQSGDAYHITSPNPDSSGGYRSMKNALDEGLVDPSQIGYVNCHATSTLIGDQIENRSVKKLFESHSKNLQLSSFKGSIGHMLGAAGSAEFVLSLMACKRGIIPPSINIESLDDDFDLNYVPNQSQAWKWTHDDRRYGIKNSFGFGGTNCSLCFASID